MKEMDNCAGASAFRHARTNVVTVAISELEFLQWIRLGSICNIRSRVIFSSQKAMEVEVIATVTTMHNIDEDDDESKNVVAKGIFTFVSLNDQHKPIPVPPLKLETAEDIESAFQGQQRYEAQKKARLSSVQGK
jgi:acyl-coenzyme A thioesterase 7